MALHIYSAGWLIKNFSLAPQTGKFLRISFLSLAFLSPATLFLRRHCLNTACEYICFFGALWMGIIIIASLSMAAHDIIIFAAKRFITPSYSVHLRSCAAVAAILIVFFSIHNAFLIPEIKKVKVTIPKLPQAMHNLKIVQISDMHIDFNYNIGQFEKIVKKINAAKPELILMTGDFLDPPMLCNDHIAKIVKSMKPKFGIFAVLGNHEYYYGYKKSLECYKRLGVKLLKNEIFEFDDFQIIGFNDMQTTKTSEADIKKIVAKRDKNKFPIIITHQAKFFSIMAEIMDFLAFTGHTHRGQIFPSHLFAKAVHKYFYGLYKIHNSHLYVTSGMGSWGPKMRFLAPAEIPLITLIKK